MKTRFLRIVALFSIICILSLGCGCNKGTNGPTPQQQVNNFNIAEPDDTADPENTETDLQDGDKVVAKAIPQQKGKANGIDVSKWQGKIDFKKVKEDGISFAIIRIGYRGENGKLYKDPNADYNIQQAIKNRILVGVYFFSTAVSTKESIEEANFTLSLIKSYKISYPVVYDCEGFKNSDSRMYNIDAAARTDNALAFLSTVKKAGYDAMFYASKSDLEDITAFNVERIADKYMIWVAQYKTPTYPESQNPDYTGKYDMWQYTNKGTVSGIVGNVDMVLSYFEKGEQSPKDKTAKVETAKPPKTEEELLYTDVNETVTAKDEVNLRKGAGTNFDIVAKLSNGNTLKRTGIGKNGWSRLNYNGQTVYAVTSYLTTDINFKTENKNEDIVEGNVFTSHNDKVTAKEEVNLRALPTTNSKIVAKFYNGEVLQRTAKSNKGWSRLNYNGQVVYAVTSYLTDDLTYRPQKESDIKTQFRDVSEQVTAKSETNLRDKPSVETGKVVYTLKNGEYLQRTGISDNGFSRLIYNGQTVYAVSSYLTK